jgi:recombinational DNA repair protein (RecF pathway)
VIERGIAGAWRIIGEAGFTPALEDCAACHVALARAALVAFSHPAGGALCASCAQRAASARMLPAAARDTLRGWLLDAEPVALSARDARAHQRLLREFIREHVTSDDRPLRAFAAWESDFGAPGAPGAPGATGAAAVSGWKSTDA